MKKISALARMGIAHRCFGNPIPQEAYDLIEATEKCVEEFNPSPSVDFKGHSSLADMINGHICVWRAALEAQKEEAIIGAFLEVDDVTYYDHELKALREIENAVEQLLK